MSIASSWCLFAVQMVARRSSDTEAASVAPPAKVDLSTTIDSACTGKGLATSRTARPAVPSTPRNWAAAVPLKRPVATAGKHQAAPSHHANELLVHSETLPWASSWMPSALGRLAKPRNSRQASDEFRHGPLLGRGNHSGALRRVPRMKRSMAAGVAGSGRAVSHSVAIPSGRAATMRRSTASVRPVRAISPRTGPSQATGFAAAPNTSRVGSSPKRGQAR